MVPKVPKDHLVRRVLQVNEGISVFLVNLVRKVLRVKRVNRVSTLFPEPGVKRVNEDLLE
jgi:hypothetical protein